MSYLYSGEFTFREGDEDNIETIIDILRVADEEFLDDVSSVADCVASIQTPILATFLCLSFNTLTATI